MKNAPVILSIFLALLFSPVLFWGDMRYVGGDDSKLYYYFPTEYLTRFTTTLISDNSLGSLGFYFSQSYISGFALVLSLLRSVFPNVNLQSALFGGNLAFGFLFFSLFLGRFIHTRIEVRIVASLAYVLSTFAIHTLWQSQLFSVYLVSFYPALFYLVTRYLAEGNTVLGILACLLSAIFSMAVFSVPWIAALLIVSVPLLLVIPGLRSSLFPRGIFLFALFVLLNGHWLVPFLYSPYSSDDISVTDMSSTVASTEMREASADAIYSVAKYNSVAYPFLGLFHKSIQQNFGWKTFGIFMSWNMKLIALGVIPLVFMLGGVFLLKKTSREKAVVYLSALSSWLLALFLFTVNFGDWGIDVFTWLNDTLPGFVMFRNMYDKFGLALSFSSSVLFAASLSIIFENVNKKFFVRISTVVLLAIIVLNATPFVSGIHNKQAIWTTSSTFGSISDFNNDFYSLVDYLKAMDEPSRFLWLPLNNANYVQIRDKNLENHYYSGVSPLQFLANKSDFNGKLSFPSKVSEEMFQNIKKGDYESIGKDFQRFNVEHIIVNNDISPDLQQSYLFGQDLYDSQMNDDFMRAILGPKVKDFGERYSLYEIHPSFRNEKIYLTEDLSGMPSDFSRVEYHKIASYEYAVSIKGLKGKRSLVFLNPYHKQWEWYFQSDRAVFMNGSHDLVFDYANGWTIDSEEIKKNFPKDRYHENPDGSVDIDLTLYFKPQDYFYPGLAVSGVTLVGSLGYLGWYGVQKLRLLRRKKEE